MIWPVLEQEHLTGAVISHSLALGWLAWTRSNRFVEEEVQSDPAWHWLAGAMLFGGVELITWISLAELQLEQWPAWAGHLFAAMVAARGLAAGLAGLLWWGVPLTSPARWGICLAGVLFGTALPAVVPGLAALGWLVVAGAFWGTTRNGLPLWFRRSLGAMLLLIAGVEVMTPNLTTLFLRMPSEQLLIWNSRELVVFLLRGLALLGASLVLWIEALPKRGRLVGVAAGVGLLVAVLAWREWEEKAAASDAAWAEAESIAHAILPAASVLRGEQADTARPEFAAIAAQLEVRNPTPGGPQHFWLWTLREGTVIHLIDSASRSSKPGLQQTPPGYPYRQLANLPLRATREVRFESGPYFVSGERRVGRHVPLRDAAGRPLAWLQVAYRYTDWAKAMQDVRVPAAIGLLYLAGIGMFVAAATNWNQATQQIHARIAAVAAGARARNLMSGFVSHELRTPLQVMLGQLELLSAMPLAPEARQAYRVLNQQSQHLLELVNDTLDLCALEARAMPLRPVRFSPLGLAAAVVTEIRPLATQHGLTLELVPEANLPPLVEADAQRLRQILINLLANAVKYTPAGRVELSVAAEAGPPDRLVLVVTDTGPGLPQGVMARLGEPFQLGPAGTGTGIGLALVQRLCGLLGGTLMAECPATGGSRITVRLPAPRATPTVDMPAARASADPAPDALAGLRVVLAEDNTLVREILQTNLQQLGAEVEAVADGAAALAACRLHAPHAVILDVMMPVINGRKVAQALHAAASGQLRPQLLVGLSAQALSEEEARADGFDHFFIKPVSRAKLAAVLAPLRPTAGQVGVPSSPMPAGASPGRLLALFASEAPAQLAALHAAVARQDRPEVGRLAHYLQSSAYALNDEPLRAACAALKNWAEKDREPADGTQPLQRVETELIRLMRRTNA